MSDSLRQVNLRHEMVMNQVHAELDEMRVKGKIAKDSEIYNNLLDQLNDIPPGFIIYNVYNKYRQYSYLNICPSMRTLNIRQETYKWSKKINMLIIYVVLFFGIYKIMK